MRNNTSRGIFVAACAAVLALPAMAATGPELFVGMFSGKSVAAGEVKATADGSYLYFGKTYEKSPAERGLHLGIYESDATLEYGLTPEWQLLVGHKIEGLQLGTSTPGLSNQYMDQSLAVGLMYKPTDSQWSFALAAGAGYAGNDPYGDSNAVYGKAAFLARYNIDTKSALLLTLDYNGNRTIFPDVPLPGIAYLGEPLPNLSYIVGVPYSRVTWKPIENVTLGADYIIPSTVGASVSWQVLQGLTLFGDIGSHTFAFFNETGNDRVFFKQMRAEAGVTVGSLDLGRLQLRALLAGGYAFNQRFTQGFDSRDQTDLMDFKPAPYARIGLEGSF